MATTVNLASGLTGGWYTGTGIALEADYATIMFTWANVNGYPEVMVEQSIDGTSYFPIYQQRTNYEEVVKFRIKDTGGVYSLNLYPLLASTAYVRVKINANGANVGTITFDASVGA